MDPSFALMLCLYGKELVNTFIIDRVMAYLLPIPNFVAFYAKLNEI